MEDSAILRRRRGRLHRLSQPLAAGPTPRRHGNVTSISSIKHQLQSSPGSKDEIIGCPALMKCLRAWRFFESSQHPTWPQLRHRRKCTQESPESKHSTQPAPDGVTTRTLRRCLQGLCVLAIANKYIPGGKIRDLEFADSARYGSVRA